jgi:hypothetical protein
MTTEFPVNDPEPPDPAEEPDAEFDPDELQPADTAAIAAKATPKARLLLRLVPDFIGHSSLSKTCLL